MTLRNPVVLCRRRSRTNTRSTPLRRDRPYRPGNRHGRSQPCRYALHRRLWTEWFSGAGDGVCDDGGTGSENAECTFGTDCTDCGSRPAGELPTEQPPTETCGDLDALAGAAAAWGDTLAEYAAQCCTVAENCAALSACPTYHECLRPCFGKGVDQDCIQACQADNPGFNDGGVYQDFSGCVTDL